MYSEEDLQVVITMADARAVGGCVNGWRTFVEHHGYLWREVVLHGLTVKQMLDTEDGMAKDIVDYVLTEKLNGS